MSEKVYKRKIRKINHSYLISIPRPVAKRLGLKAGDSVLIAADNDMIILKKIKDTITQDEFEKARKYMTKIQEKLNKPKEPRKRKQRVYDDGIDLDAQDTEDADPIEEKKDDYNPYLDIRKRMEEANNTDPIPIESKNKKAKDDEERELTKAEILERLTIK